MTSFGGLFSDFRWDFMQRDRQKLCAPTGMGEWNARRRKEMSKGGARVPVFFEFRCQQSGVARNLGRVIFTFFFFLQIWMGFFSGEVERIYMLLLKEENAEEQGA